MGKGGAIAGLVTLLIIIFFFAAYAYDYSNMKHMVEDKGCEPLVANQYGMATAYECPVARNER